MIRPANGGHDSVTREWRDIIGEGLPMVHLEQAGCLHGPLPTGCIDDERGPMLDVPTPVVIRAADGPLSGARAAADQVLDPALRASEDRALLRAICDQDQQAFAEFFRRYERTCWTRARSLLVDGALADEVVQAVFLDVWRHAPRYEPARGPVSSWLSTLTHHKAVDAIRREAFHRRGRIGDETVLGQTAAPTSSPETQVVRRCEAERVRAAFRQLSTAQRETLFLAYFEHLTYREIAQRLGVPLGTVKSRGRLALLALRSLLQPDLA